jgi:hypothetical protein
MLVGPALHEYFDAQEKANVKSALDALARIEALLAERLSPPDAPVGIAGQRA